MASPPSLPTRSFFSPMRWVLTLLAAPAPERDGSKADSFPFDDNRDEKQKEGIPKIVSRDENQKEGILKIVSSGVVVSEKAAHREPDAREAADEDGCEHNLHTSAQDFLSKLMGRAPEGSSELHKIISSGVVVSENAAHREPDAREADEEEGSEDNHHSLVLEDWGARIYGWLHWYCSIEFALKGLFKPIHRPPFLDGASFHAGDDMDSNHYFILDSGASMHATGNLSLLSEFTRAPAGSAAAVYHTRDGRDLGIAGAGIIAGDKFHLPHVHYVPGLGTRCTLVSVQQLAGCDFLVMFCGGSCYVKNRSNGSLVGMGRMHHDDGFYHLDFLSIPLVATDGAT